MRCRTAQSSRRLGCKNSILITSYNRAMNETQEEVDYYDRHFIQAYFAVNSRDTGSMSTTSDTSPPLKFSAAEESSPENRPSPMMTPHRLRNGQSTESLDSLSDESGNHGGRHHNRSSGGGGRNNRSHHNTPAGSGVGAQNPVARPRRVRDVKNWKFY